MSRIDALVYLPLKPAKAKAMNLPLKLPVLAEDLQKIAENDEIDSEVIVRGLRKQCEVSRDDYYESYLLYHLYELFKKKLSNNEYGVCGELLEEARSIREDYRYPFYRALFMIKLGEIERAELDLRSCISIKPDFYIGYHELGKLLISREEYEDAIVSFERAIDSSNGTFHLPVIGILDAYISLGQFQTALSIIERLPENFALYTDAQLRRGVVLNELQQYKQAEIAFSQAINKEERWLFFYNRAFSRTRMGKLQEAMNDLHHAYQLSSTPVVLYELGLLKRSIGLVEDAFADLKSYYETTDDPKACVALSITSLLLGEYEVAISYAEISDRRTALKEMIITYGYLEGILDRPSDLEDPLLASVINSYESGIDDFLDEILLMESSNDKLFSGCVAENRRIDYGELLDLLGDSGLPDAPRKRILAFSSGRIVETIPIDMSAINAFLDLIPHLSSNLREIDVFTSRFPYIVSGEGQALAICKSLGEVYKWALGHGKAFFIEILERLVLSLRDLDDSFAREVSRIVEKEVEFDSLLESADSDVASFALAVLYSASAGTLDELASTVVSGSSFVKTLVKLVDMEVYNDE